MKRRVGCGGIELDNLSKVFRVNQKEAGLGGAFKAMVRPRYLDKAAVAGISLSVDAGEVVGYIGLLTWIVPYGFASFYPASFLLGRDVGPVIWISPLVAAVLLVVGYRLWLVGLNRYEGTGS